MPHPSMAIWKRTLVRQASKMARLKAKPPEDFRHSWFGKVLVAAPGEAWPEHQGKPMWPLCQINCGQLPYMPESLADISLIAVFIAPGELPDGTENGDGWCLRAYPANAEMVAITIPKIESPIRPFAVQWELIASDYPTHDDLPADFPDDLADEYSDLEVFDNQGGTKVGGWPTNIQSEIFWAPMNQHPANPEYIFQIDSEPKANWQWGDSGVGYFGRGTGAARDVWTMAWQCT